MQMGFCSFKAVQGQGLERDNVRTLLLLLKQLQVPKAKILKYLLPCLSGLRITVALTFICYDHGTQPWQCGKDGIGRSEVRNIYRKLLFTIDKILILSIKSVR